MNNPLSPVIKILLCSAFMMNAGTFMVIPFLVVYLSKHLQFSPVEVGTILSANLFFGRLLPFFTGLIGDRLKHSSNLIIGIVLRGIGFIGYAIVDSFSGLIFVSALVGIGGAFYDPSIMTIFASQEERKRKKTLTYLNQALNAGAVLGPLFAAGLLLLNPTIPFIISGGILVVISIVVMIFAKRIKTKKSSTNLFLSIKEIISNKAYVKYLFTMTIYWIAFSQLSVSIPLYVFHLTNDEKFISAVYTINGLTGIILMFLLRNLFTKKVPLSLIQKGTLISGISFLMLPVFGNLAWLLFAVFIFTVGETLILPSSDMAIAEYSNDQHTGGYYGLFELSFALGTIIGNYIGTYLMEVNKVFPWFIYGGLSIITFVLISLLRKNSKDFKVITDSNRRV